MKHIYKHLTVLLLVFALVASAVPATDIAKAVDLDSPCTLTVSPGGSEYEDLQEAGVQIDLYKVAEAVSVEGYDAYTYSNCSGFESLDLENVQDNETWAQLAKKATQAVMDNGSYPDAGGTVRSAISVDSGLYLLVARGADDDGNFTISKDDEGNDIYTTSVSTPTHKYVYAPTLVSLPGKEGDSGEWIDDVSISLKPEQQGRFGSLEIKKNLTDYVDGCPATFIFQIEAVSNGKLVYSDVVSVSFDSAGTRSVLLNDIPVGAEVTVTEIYTGVCYRLVTEETQTVVIDAEQTASVEFTNEYSGVNNNGGGITNSFEYDNDTGWSWTQISQS